MGRARRDDVGWVIAAGAVMVLATVNFAGGIGASSLFVDEAFSWIVAAHPLGQIYAQVKLSEVAPPAYYVLLHLWLGLGHPPTETWMRIPSVVAGLALVATTVWLGRLLAGRWAGVLAGLLVAVSPLALQYAQQARAYVFVMLAVTLAAAMVLRAIDPATSRPVSWLTGSALCSVAAIWLHYTCLGVVIVLAACVLSSPRFTARVKATYLLALVVAQALVTPLLVHQASTGNPGADAYAHLTVLNAFAVLGNPVDGQYPVLLWTVVVAALAYGVAATVLLIRGGAAGSRRATVTVFAASLLPLIGLFAITIAAKPVLIARYCAVSLPLCAVVLAAACVRWWFVAGVPFVLVLALAIRGSIIEHGPVARWPDLHAAFRQAGADWRAGDRMVIAGDTGPLLDSAPIVIYYTDRFLPAGSQTLVAPSLPTLLGLLRAHRRLWIVGSTATVAQTNAAVAALHDHVALDQLYVTDEPLQLTLIGPAR